LNFKVVTCSKCGNKQIENFMNVGTHCNACKIGLHQDTEDIRKDVRKEQVECADAFSRSFEEFREHLKHEEERWNKENVFVEFKTVSIPDDDLLIFASKYESE